MKYFRLFTSGYIFAKLYAFVKYFFINEDKCWKIKVTPNKGDGLFTTKFRKKGSVIFVATGKTKYWHATTQEDADNNPNWYNVMKDTWIDMQEPYVKVNHSCTPNIGIDGTRIFVALRDIAVDEEFSFDYSLTEEEDLWEMPCSCDSENCTGSISAVQKIPSKRYAISYPYVPKYMQSVRKHHLAE